jgi:hypothetical protein
MLMFLGKCNSSRTLQYLQQRQRNASLQQLYNSGNSLGMGVEGVLLLPLNSRHEKTQCLLAFLPKDDNDSQVLHCVNAKKFSLTTY